MEPLFISTELLVIDRHDIGFTGTKQELEKVYAIAEGAWLSIGYLKRVGRQLLLHPRRQPSSPIVVTLAPQHNNPTHSIVGTVCYVQLDVRKRGASTP